MCSKLLPALHVSNHAKVSCILHLRWKRAVRVEPHSDSARSDDSWHRGVIVSLLIVAVSQTAVCVIALDVRQHCFIWPRAATRRTHV